ncbi:hypothetical protein Vadar_019040 [Vaccinium darrowii]|uniref:Uncharacterized protein n=1 Tax=Vaccinium darrowii TaxID=229202 RepID=A0ACB7ZL76_9ERIC|nr:hypothetical protein Vadar_019040 [Vaccinium darrowii]
MRLSRKGLRMRNDKDTTSRDLDVSAEEGGNSSDSIRCLAEPRVVRKIRIVAEQTPIHPIPQPPTIASLLAIIIGMVPQIKALFFGDDSPQSVISDSLEILAGAMVPSVMLILGEIMVLADKLHFLVDGDQMYGFVLLLQYTTPSATLLCAVASLRSSAVSEASSLLEASSLFFSSLLFWQRNAFLLAVAL